MLVNSLARYANAISLICSLRIFPVHTYFTYFSKHNLQLELALHCIGLYTIALLHIYISITT